MKNVRNLARKYGPVLSTAAAIGLIGVNNAHAVFSVDNTEANANVVIAGIAVVGTIVVLTSFQVAKWAAMQVKKLFGR